MKWIAAAALTAGVLMTPLAARAQQNPVPKTRSEIVSAARDVMQRAKLCTLITLGSDGAPQARTVDNFPPDEDMTVWIGTNPVTRKVAEIQRDPRVALHCLDSDGSGYVTLISRAEVVRDAATRAAHWKPGWKQFYKDEYRGDDYVLLKLLPVRLEIVSYTHGMLNDPKTWRPVTLEFGK